MKMNFFKGLRWLFPILILGLPAFALAEDPPALSEFHPILGQWQGELVYVDYGDDSTRVTLPTWLTCSRSKKGDSLRLEYRFSEPDGSKVDGFELLRIPKKPEMLFFDGLFDVEEVQTDSEGALSRVVLSTRGKDNNRSATIRKTILIDGDSLRFRKEVRYEGAGDFILRNEYRLQRVPS